MKEAISMKYGGDFVDAADANESSYFELGLVCPCCHKSVRWVKTQERTSILGVELYAQNYRNDIMVYEVVADAAHFTLSEWIEYCGDDIEPWQPEITIGVDNVRTAEESQARLKNSQFESLFTSI